MLKKTFKDTYWTFCYTYYKSNLLQLCGFFMTLYKALFIFKLLLLIVFSLEWSVIL